MMGNGGLESEFEAELERARVIRPIPGLTRTRVLGRARAFVAAEAMSGRVVAPMAPSRPRRFRLAVAASMTLLLGVAGATAAVLLRKSQVAVPFLPASASVASRGQLIVPEVARETASGGVEPSVNPKRRHLTHVVSNPRESYAAELQLLQRAQVAYRTRDFLGTLLLVAEHARHFQNGRLAEEREALRVRSLVALGRREEARQVIATFQVRFPRSVLLPRLRDAVGTTAPASE